jgi:hypothetical protein
VIHLEPTADPHVFIEERREDYVRYRNRDGRRWEVHGVCDRRGDCLIGSTIEGVYIANHDELRIFCAVYGRSRADHEMDVPVTPEFRHCCPFTYTELAPVESF